MRFYDRDSCSEISQWVTRDASSEKSGKSTHRQGHALRQALSKEKASTTSSPTISGHIALVSRKTSSFEILVFQGQNADGSDLVVKALVSRRRIGQSCTFRVAMRRRGA